jgi:hypothetical protein
MMLPISDVSTTWPLPVFSRAYNAAVTPHASIKPPISSPIPGSIWLGGLPFSPAHIMKPGSGNARVVE